MLTDSARSQLQFHPRFLSENVSPRQPFQLYMSLPVYFYSHSQSLYCVFSFAALLPSPQTLPSLYIFICMSVPILLTLNRSVIVIEGARWSSGIEAACHWRSRPRFASRRLPHRAATLDKSLTSPC